MDGHLSICLHGVYRVTTCRPGRDISWRPPAYSLFWPKMREMESAYTDAPLMPEACSCRSIVKPRLTVRPFNFAAVFMRIGNPIFFGADSFWRLSFGCIGYVKLLNLRYLHSFYFAFLFTLRKSRNLGHANIKGSFLLFCSIARVICPRFSK